MLKTMPLIIATDGVTIPFRSLPKTPKGKIIWKEIKVALLARYGKHSTISNNQTTRLYEQRFVAVLGDIDQLKSRLQLEALRQGVGNRFACCLGLRWSARTLAIVSRVFC